jgi:hypothetical protein
MTYITPYKAASVPSTGNGVYRGRVVAVNGSLVDVVVPRMTQDSVWSNCEVLSAPNTPMLAVNDLVYVAFIEGFPDDLVVLGPIRLIDTLGPGDVPGASGYVDPLEEYPYTRDGGVTVGTSFRWPVRRSAQITELIATLVTPSTNGDVVVRLIVNNTILGTITIAEGTTNATATINVSVAAGEMLTFSVVEAGAEATTLFIAARGRAVIPDSLSYIDEYAFGFGGAVTTGQSHLYPARRRIDIDTIRATLTTGGAGAITFDVLVNGDVAASVSIEEGTSTIVQAVSFSLTVDDELSVIVTDAPTGATNLGVFIRGQL